jgi:hypothetical protein
MAGDSVPGRRVPPQATPRPAQRGIKQNRCICIHSHDGKRLLRVLEHPSCPEHGRGGDWRCLGAVDAPEPRRDNEATAGP